VSEKGIAPLHFAMFSDHELVQRAATEAMCNLVPHQAMMEHLSQAENLKLWLAFASDYEERYECARAAAGCLAMATQDESIALELVTLEKFGAHMTSMVESGRLEIMHRSFYIVLNLVTHGGDCKEKVVAEGLAAFCKIYVDKYHSNKGTDELEFSPEEMALLPVTVELAKKIVSSASET
jgi:protein unc-45